MSGVMSYEEWLEQNPQHRSFRWECCEVVWIGMGIDTLPNNISDVVELFQELAVMYPGDDYKLDWDATDNLDDGRFHYPALDLTVLKKVPETDDEFEARKRRAYRQYVKGVEAQERAIRQAREVDQRERAEYERLKAKYGDN